MPTGRAPRRQTVDGALRARPPWHAMHGHCGSHHEGRIDRCEPVGFDPRMQRMPDEIGYDGPDHDVDQHARTARARLARDQRGESHGAENEHQRRRKRELGRQQLGDEDGTEILDPRTSELLDEGDPLVIGVPEQHGGEHGKRHQGAEIGPKRDQPAPHFWDGYEPDQDRRAKEHRGVFRKQCGTDGRADRKPPRATAGLEQLGAEQQHEAGGDQQRRVRRHDHGADRGHQRDVEQKRRGRSDPHAAEQDLGGPIDRVAHGKREQDRDQPHAELGVAGDQSAGADHQRDHRRMVVIAAGKMLRPHPVIGFVEGDRRHRTGDQPQADERCDGQPDVADQPRIIASCRRNHRLRQTNSPEIA